MLQLTTLRRRTLLCSVTFIAGVALTLISFLHCLGKEAEGRGARIRNVATLYAEQMHARMEDTVNTLHVLNLALGSIAPASPKQIRQLVGMVSGPRQHIAALSYHRSIPISELPRTSAKESWKSTTWAMRLTKAGGDEMFERHYAVVDLVANTDSAVRPSRLDGVQEIAAKLAARGTAAAPGSTFYPSSAPSTPNDIELALPFYEWDAEPNAYPVVPSGFTSATIRIDSLLQVATARVASLSAIPVAIELYQGTRAVPNALVARTALAPPSARTAPQPCVFNCASLASASTLTLAGKPWHLLVREHPVSLMSLHSHSLTLLLAGLIASAGATLFVHLAWRKASKAKDLALQRTAELRSLNAILVADIEAHKELADSLTRSHREIRLLAEHNARVKEDERKRIAREIHDDLGQSMLALRIELSQVDSSSQTERDRERLKHSLEYIDHTVNAMRLIINELRPTVLDLGLEAAIDWEISKFRRRTGIHTSLVVRTALPELSDEIATALYRIVQESMTNILRHARASHVVVTLWCENGWVFVTLADDGIGMSEQCRRKANSYGLIGIAERIYALGGAFDTDSPNGGGTTLTVAVPYAPLAELDRPAATTPEPPT